MIPFPSLSQASLPITDPVLIVAVAAAIFLITPILSERLRVPGMVGVIVAGALVGPNGLNLLQRDHTIVLLGTVGLLYLMFLAGSEIDLHGFRRYRSRSIGFGALTFILPQTLGTGVGLILGYSLVTSILLAWLGRWFFRRERTGGIAAYLFVFTALFAGAYLAEVAGVEAIIGAFLVGLALNRLIPALSCGPIPAPHAMAPSLERWRESLRVCWITGHNAVSVTPRCMYVARHVYVTLPRGCARL